MLELKKVAQYVTDKIDVALINTPEYITTDNMMPNRGGVIECESLPQASRVTKYAPGDTLVSNIRPYFKKIWYADRVSGCSNDVIVFRLIDESWNKKFLYYVLSQDAFFDHMMSGANGTKMPRGNKKIIPDFLVPDFDYEKQTRIAEVLSAYDSLIENNQKQIKLLEEAAQRLYKEWFVDLHFPGYEDTPIVDGVPERWEKVPVGNLISYEIGGGWGEETPTGKCIREAYVIRGTDLYGIAHGDLLSIPFRYHVESNLSSRKLKDGDIVFEVSGGSRTEGVARCLLITSSMLNVWRKDVMCASFCKLIRPQFGFSQYLHDCIKHLRATGKTEEYDKRSASSIVNYRWKDFLSQELVLRPSEEILDHYNGVAKEIYSKAINCSLQIESAKKARDRLLPKLMSGEIEI